jgi:DNA-binding response OmpR family regulator
MTGSGSAHPRKPGFVTQVRLVPLDPEADAADYHKVGCAPTRAPVRDARDLVRAAPPERKWIDIMILIVDDETSALVLLEMVLRREEQVIRKASSGREALRILDRVGGERCDLLITDIRMPEMDGRELVARMRTKPALASIPVIMCTSLVDRATVIELIGQGVRDYIVKPFRPTIVLEKVRAILAETEPVVEPPERTIARLRISMAQYGPLAAATLPSLDKVTEELATSLHARDVKGVRAAAQRAKEPATLFGAARATAAADCVLIAGPELDALQFAGVLMTEIGELRSALQRSRPGERT